MSYEKVEREEFCAPEGEFAILALINSDTFFLNSLSDKDQAIRDARSIVLGESSLDPILERREDLLLVRIVDDNGRPVWFMKPTYKAVILDIADKVINGSIGDELGDR